MYYSAAPLPLLPLIAATASPMLLPLQDANAAAVALLSASPLLGYCFNEFITAITYETAKNVC